MRERKNNITLDVDSALALMQEIYNDVEKNRFSATPFGYQAICDDESNLQKCAQLYSSKRFPEIKNNF